jgi:hypothetical protein
MSDESKFIKHIEECSKIAIHEIDIKLFYDEGYWFAES